MEEFLTEESVLLKQKNKLRWTDILGSAFLFASAYLFLYTLYDLATAVTAAHYNLTPTLFFDTIHFSNSSDAWCNRCVKITYSIGAFVMLITGVGFYLIYLIVKTSGILVRLLLLWLSLLSFVILSQRIMSAFMAPDFLFRDLGSLGMELGIVSAYFYFNSAELVAMLIVGILILLGVGILYAKPFLQTATSVYQIDIPMYRRRFLWHHLLFPPIIGSILITLVVFPKNIVPNFITFAILPISLVSIWFFAVRSTQLIRRQPLSKYWPVFALIIFLAIVSLVHTVLKTGIPITNPKYWF